MSSYIELLYQENSNVHCSMFFFLSWWISSQLRFNWTEIILYYIYIYVYIYILMRQYILLAGLTTLNFEASRGSSNTKVLWYNETVCLWITIYIVESLVNSYRILVMRIEFMCPWCNGYRRRNWTRRHEFKSWTRLIAFHIALIPLGKVWIQLFSLQLWTNSRTD